MNWLVTLACLTCADTSAYVVTEVASRAECIRVAEKVWLTAIIRFPEDERVKVQCIERKDWREEFEAYPQRR